MRTLPLKELVSEDAGCQVREDISGVFEGNPGAESLFSFRSAGFAADLFANSRALRWRHKMSRISLLCGCRKRLTYCMGLDPDQFSQLLVVCVSPKEPRSPQAACLLVPCSQALSGSY